MHKFLFLGLMFCLLGGTPLRADDAPSGARQDATGIVLRVYREMLQREPDAAGLSAYAAQVADGKDAAWLRRVLAASAEYRKREAARSAWFRAHVGWPGFVLLCWLVYAWISRRDPLVRWASVCATLAAGGLYFGLVAVYAVNIPVGDDFDSVLGWSNKPAAVRWAHIADFNNEHRIVASRLAVEAVRAVSGVVDFKAMTILMNVSLLPLLYLFWLELRARPVARPWFPLVPLLLFSPMSWFNMTQGTPYALVATLVFGALFVAQHARTWVWLPASFLLVVCATLSMLPGFLAFPLLPVAAALRRLDPGRHPGVTWRVLLCRGFVIEAVSLVLATVVVGLLYFRGCPLSAPHASSPVAFSWFAAIPYTLRFAGAFAGGALSLPVGGFFLGVLLWGTLRGRWAHSPAFLLMAVFVFLNGAAAAFTRMPLGFSPEDFRYRIYPLVLAVCILGLLADLAPDALRRRGLLAVAGGFVVAIFTLSVADNVPRLAQRRAESLGATAAWVRGVGGPCFPREGRAHAGAVLTESIRQGLYILPAAVRGDDVTTPPAVR